MEALLFPDPGIPLLSVEKRMGEGDTRGVAVFLVRKAS